MRFLPGFLLATAIGAAGWAWQAGWLRLPDAFNPWSELDPLATPNLLTPYKLRRARDDAPQCIAALTASGVRFEPVADRPLDDGCGWSDAVRLTRGQRLAFKTPVLLSCRTALSFAMWERHALIPAAEAELGGALVGIEHLGSYACRSVRTDDHGSNTSQRRSRHATGDAIDISGFSGPGTKRISVRQGWEGTPTPGGPDASRFLRAARDGACRFFDGVLSPDYNAAHADHFHLEVGGWRTCR